MALSGLEKYYISFVQLFIPTFVCNSKWHGAPTWYIHTLLVPEGWDGDQLLSIITVFPQPQTPILFPPQSIYHTCNTNTRNNMHSPHYETSGFDDSNNSPSLSSAILWCCPPQIWTQLFSEKALETVGWKWLFCSSRPATNLFAYFFFYLLPSQLVLIHLFCLRKNSFINVR